MYVSRAYICIGGLALDNDYLSASAQNIWDGRFPGEAGSNRLCGVALRLELFQPQHAV